MSVRPVIVASHPRSGTHLTIDFIRRHFPACRGWKLPGEPLSRLYLNVDGLMQVKTPTSPRRARRTLQRSDRPLVKSHLLPDYTRLHMPDMFPGRLADDFCRLLDENGTFIYAVRDGRDVLCSYHVFASQFDETAQCELGRFLRSRVNGRSRVGIWAHHVRQWLARPSTTILRFEDVLADPASALSTIRDAIGESPVPRSPLLPAPFESVRQVRLARLISVRPGATTTIGRPAGQPRVGWREAFSEKDLLFFEKEAGDVLKALGYA